MIELANLTPIFSHNVDFVKKPGAPPELCFKNIAGKDVEVRTIVRKPCIR